MYVRRRGKFFVDAAAEFLEFVHVDAHGSSFTVKSCEFCIIGTRCVARKEENWRFRMSGSSDWSAGRVVCGVFLAAAETSSRVRRFARRAERSSASAPRGATFAARACAFLSRLFSKKFSGVFGEHEAPVTTVLLIANFVMLGVSWMALAATGGGGGLSILWGLSGETQYRLGMSIPLPYLFLSNEWWRLVTAMFLHGGLLHIGFNMMALMQFGPAIEELYGSARYLFIYVFTGAFGFLLSAYSGQLFAGRKRRIVRACRRDARGHLEARRLLHARLAFATDQFGRHSVCAGIFWFHGHGQLGAWRRSGVRIRVGEDYSQTGSP